MDPGLASNIARNFLERIQSVATPPPGEADQWIQLPDTLPPTWERARWVNGETLDRDLRDVLDHDAAVIDAPDEPSSKRAESILRRKGPYVALLAPDGRFKELIDRQALLEKVGADVAKAG